MHPVKKDAVVHLEAAIVDPIPLVIVLGGADNVSFNDNLRTVKFGKFQRKGGPSIDENTSVGAVGRGAGIRHGIAVDQKA